METCDTSAQGTFSKGWFWEPGERMKEVRRELLPLYRNAIRRGANLLLNVAIDREGRIPSATIQCLHELTQAIHGGT
jgi:alpha-L-fucosidase